MKWSPILAFACLLAACQAPLRPYEPAANPLAISAAEYDAAFDAAVDALRDHGFLVDRQDYRFGEITTDPLVSPTIAEPWRPQNTTVAQALESTLNHVRRVARVSLAPVDGEAQAALDDAAAALQPGGDAAAPADATTDPAATYLLRVEVLTQNQQVPVRRLTMGSQNERYSTLAALPAEWKDRDITGNYWVTTGRDAHLEERLIRAILDRAGVDRPAAGDDADPGDL